MKKYVLVFCAVVFLLALCSCGEEKGPYYHVDYNGQKDFFKNAEDEYRAGEKITLYYEFGDNVKSYYFYLDDAPLVMKKGDGSIRDLNRYVKGKGWKWEFQMPDHDISIRVEPHTGY